MYIRRKQSALHFGKSPRQARRQLFWIFLGVICGALILIWQFDKVQPKVLAIVSGTPTSTPKRDLTCQTCRRSLLGGRFSVKRRVLW